jgi:hypothetical protein
MVYPIESKEWYIRSNQRNGHSNKGKLLLGDTTIFYREPMVIGLNTRVEYQ